MSWTLAQAKDQLSEVVRRAVDDGPQTISVRGRETAVVLSKSQFEQLRDPQAPTSLKDLLLAMDLDGVDLSRDPTPTRDLDF
jgi:prevent-host-death family protein